MADAIAQLVASLSPDARSLVIAVVVDIVVGDPVYAWHPVRLMGRTLVATERRLRRAGLDGYGGGILLFIALSLLSLGVMVGVMVGVMYGASGYSSLLTRVIHIAVLYSLLALGDLARHVWRIEAAVQRGDMPAAHRHVAALVGRDTDAMDAAACRRAAIESLSENLTDGFVSPVCWYVVAGLPGVVVFKVASTMDSMVGYKTPRYLRFGWCGARLDDVMNYLPARLTWLVMAVVAAVLPGLSGRKAWRVGLQQHKLLPGPNAGWSEAAAAGALERRIAGPIWLKGVQVNEMWIGDGADPAAGSHTDVIRTLLLVLVSGVVVVGIGSALLVLRGS